MNFQWVRIVDVNTVLVAGMRYDLTLELTTPGTSDPRRYCASVWEKLDGKIVLWDWEIIDEIGFSPKITDLANFAVNTLNCFGNTDLQLVRILKASTNPAFGLRFVLTLELTANGASYSKVYRHGSRFHAEVRDAKTNELVNDLANFAVEEYNQKENAHLRFLELLHATCSEVVAGMSYNIVVALDDGYDITWQKC
ncbi:hypothetical protein RJ639_022187 [Escallonia herrerae]|uniref:Cysteine proteinase inhibitor n=1 Tax=Escallonia herrerae TaxID=1293975 RepID=A0AA88V5R0_9ASTE|nr:hypothetical protein RJ639_022187 [Escallonia herrerae]